MPVVPYTHAATIGTSGSKAATIVIFLTSGTTWTVPSNWNPNNNTIEVIGAGAGGGGGGSSRSGGGAGGGYSKISNLSLSPGTITYQIGIGGTENATGTDTLFNGSGTTCATNGGSVCAKGGGSSFGNTGGIGGAAASGIGDVKKSGGNGGNGSGVSSGGGGGGGGSGGPNGDGKAGGNSGTGASAGGGGGGGADNGFVGSAGSGASGGNGGNNRNSIGAGTGGNPPTSGTVGGGGGGANAGNVSGGNGGAGEAIWTQTSDATTTGPGGGGGGGGGGTGGNAGDGGFGGFYGGGGGAGGASIIADGNGRAGRAGLIVITYTSTGTTVPIGSGLVGYWNFGGAITDWSAGTTKDTSGQGNTGSLVNMSTTTSSVPGKVGQALKYVDVNNTGVNVGTGSSLNITGNLTISAWIKPSVLATNTGRIFDKRSVTSGYYFSIRNNTGLRRIQLNTGGADTISNNNAITLGVWQHVAVTYTSSGGIISFYVNGVPQGRTTGEAAITDSSAISAAVGRIAAATTDNFDGLIDEVRVYNRALTHQDIQRLYAVGAVSFGTSPSPAAGQQTPVSNGLVGFWSFSGAVTNWGTGTTGDLSGNGNTGQLVNMSTTTTPVLGKIGQAFKFADNTQVSVGTNSSLNLTNDLTITAWIKPTYSLDQNGARNIFNKNVSFTGYDFALDNANVANGLVFHTDIAARYSSANVITYNVWQFVAVTYSASGNIVKFYVNSAPAGSAVGSTISNNVSIAGKIGNKPANAEDITIDEVRVYNRALTPQEIQQLYIAGGGKIATSPSPAAGQKGAVSNGLVGFWSFSGAVTNWGTGTTGDLSGNGNTGQLVNMSTTTSPVAGKVGQALKFVNANNTKVDVGKDSSLDITKSVSVTAWIKPTTFGGGSLGMIFDKSNSGEGYQFGLDNSTIVNGLQFNTDRGVTPAVSSASVITLDKWQFVAVSYNSADGVASFYVNGAPVGSGSPSGANPGSGPNNNGIIGQRAQNDTTRNFDGTIDEVRVYNRALNFNEINALYQSTK